MNPGRQPGLPTAARVRVRKRRRTRAAVDNPVPCYISTSIVTGQSRI
jgi:hypothetical protein